LETSCLLLSYKTWYLRIDIRKGRREGKTRKKT
jgi:hypothetical protein